MKQKILFSALSIFFCITLVNAQNEKKRYDHFKERNISKSYTASGTSLDIENSFGKVEVITWSNNEIKVDVHIEASSTDADNAEQIFNTITVTDDKKGNTVYFKTSVKGENNKGCKNCQNNMSIDYTIHVPVSVSMDISNSFGKITLPDYSGELSLSSKFGGIDAGNLGNVKKLNVEFGAANIKKLSNIDAVFKFSSVDLGSLSGSNKLKMEFCSTSKIVLTDALTSLNLNESYSTVNLKPTSNLPISFTLHTSFGTLVNRSGMDINRTDKPDEYGPDADKNFEGKSGNGSVKIDIKSSFGKIIIGEPQPGDMKEKKNKKEKTEV